LLNKTQEKKMRRRVLGLLLFLLIVPLFMGCDQSTTAENTTAAQTTVDVTTVEGTTVSTQEVLGTVTFEIYTSGDDPNTAEVETEYVSYSINAEYTEDDTLFGLVQENFSITYEESDFGRYLTSIGSLEVVEVNEYIAFYINGSYAMTGVDATDLVDGDVYAFRLETF